MRISCKKTLSQAVSNGTLNAELVWGMFNTMEGDTFVTSDLKSSSGTFYINSTEAGFDAGFLPRFPGPPLSVAKLQAVKNLYAVSGKIHTSVYSTTYDRAGYVYRDTVLSCPALLAPAATEAGWLEGVHCLSCSTCSWALGPGNNIMLHRLNMRRLC